MKCIEDGDVFDSCLLPEPFSKMKVRRTKGSSGKCWVFHKNESGSFKGFLFPSGFRIFGFETRPNSSYEFF